jgi:hypothetical protein
MFGKGQPASKEARRAANEARRVEIDQRARLLASRQVVDTGKVHWLIWVAIGIIGALWGLGVAWLCAEQARLATHLGFEVPAALPAIVDGSMFAAALLATAISLSGRASSSARMFSFAINLVSASTNGLGAYLRDGGISAVIVAAMVPLILMWLFHLVLAEIRLRVRIQRGLPAEVAPPALRVLRVVFAGRWAVTEWRAAGLAITDPLPLLDSPNPRELEVEATRPVSAITAIPAAPVVVRTVDSRTISIERSEVQEAPAETEPPIVATVLLDSDEPAPPREYPGGGSDSTEGQRSTVTALPRRASTPGRSYPAELETEIRAVVTGTMTVSDLARLAMERGIVRTSEIDTARKSARRWRDNLRMLEQ